LIFDAVDPVGGGHVVVDGYPREIGELEDLVERYSSSMIAVAVVLELSEQESIERLKLRGRFDDDDEGIKRRLEIYHKEMDVISNFLNENKVLIININGSPSIEEISQNIEKELKKWQIL
jgi:adenylate kinase family enzyme